MRALDLFAGAGGWDVAARDLRITSDGVELMPAARLTRETNGLATIGTDVWDCLDLAVPGGYDMLLASPPCQTFSMAGKGAGRRALEDVLHLIDEGAYQRPTDLRAWALEHGDERTALVLVPLLYAVMMQPTYVAFEQVPAVLPIWDGCARVLVSLGYSVVTGNVQAEQYGVPQTRRRAILVARRDEGVARLPVPTHSRYYPRDPARLDAGVLPWVSMADALGWGEGGPAARSPRGAGMRERYGTPPDRPASTPALTLRTGVGGGHGTPGFSWTHERPNGQPINLDPRRPATTVAGDPRLSSREHHNHGEQNSTSTRVTLEEAAALQSFPPGFTFAGTKTQQFLQVGNAIPPLLARAILTEVTS